MNQSARIIFMALIVLGASVGLYEAALFYNGQNVGESFAATWQTVAVLLLAMWVEADSRGRTDVYRPFEMGLFVVIFAIPYVPYYLFKTRGIAGFAWLIGAIIVFTLGYWLQWLVYLAS
jgi:hypothetical protein